MATSHRCRFCSAVLTVVMTDLGSMPWSNSFLEPTQDAIACERSYPLKVMVCSNCFLAQTTETIPPHEIFTDDYAYLSSYSTSWLQHAERYAVTMIDRLGLGRDSLVVEVASNDGYLLQYFAARGIPVLGVEPAAAAARLAVARNVPTRVTFFNRATAEALVAEGFRADLIAANNVLAHVPDIADFVAGFAVLLRDDGIATFEFPHLLRLIEGLQFDTIYHEHYSYLSLLAVERIFAACGLEVFDVESLPTHGGSLRIFGQRKGGTRALSERVAELRGAEQKTGLGDMATYARFDANVREICADFRRFVDRAREEGRTIAGYGAAAKGNTFLNACGATSADVAFVVDRNPMKQGKLLPGSHIAVRPPDAIAQERPNYLLVLPWNLLGEIRAENAQISAWGGRFVVAIPRTRIV